MALTPTSIVVSAVRGVLGGNKIFVDTAFPTAGHMDVGDRVWDNTPSASQNDGWIITRAGSLGTFASRTGSINQSSFNLTLNSAGGADVGAYITITGVTGTKKIVSKNMTTGVVTLDVAADATGINTAVAYQAPSYVKMANAQAS
jgi:hypothetical protein